MSVDIDWEKLTAGSDGAQLAETVRSFIHERFQNITLPRFIRTVKVHAFEFGDVPPEVELKDICDPLPDFYDEGSESGSAEEQASDGDEGEHLDQFSHAADNQPDHHSSRAGSRERFPSSRNHGDDAPLHGSSNVNHGRTESRQTTSSRLTTPDERLLAPITPFFYGALQSPGIPGGTANMNYFHPSLGTGLSGTATPLAAMAGAHFGASHANLHQRFGSLDGSKLKRQIVPSPGRANSSSSDSLTPPSMADPGSRPPSQHLHSGLTAAKMAKLDHGFQVKSPSPTAPSLKRPEPEPQDIQIVSHVKYNGNLRLSLTAEILLDYPMPSFVAIPLQLNITGVEFDGVAILAYIRKKAHFCFLAPEDADALVGRGSDIAFEDHDHDRLDLARPGSSGSDAGHSKKMGGLLEKIKVESAIGDKDNGKQVLRNVGKVEKFVLEQVRRLFEDELVFPSFWTVLV